MNIVKDLYFDKSSRAGCLILLLLGLFIVFGPLFVEGSPSMLGDRAHSLEQPSADHFFGTDILGRDVFIRLMHGGQASLLAAFMAVFVSALVGMLIGLFAGYGPFWLDRLLMSLTDLMLVFPRIFLVLLLVSVTKPSLSLVVIVIGITGWMSIARLVRSEVLSLRERDFVLAARGFGFSHFAIIIKHIVPHILPVVIVSMALRLGNTILLESFLSYLGLGVQHPEVSWGAMIEQGRGQLLEAWWLATIPGIAITLTVVGSNLLGDGIRNILDPTFDTKSGNHE
jgi:peptide/nickel transport system permease protein